MGTLTQRHLRALVAAGLALGAMQTALAAGKIQMDEDTWISVGAGARGLFSAVEDAAPNGDDRSTDFNLDSARIYINGQLNKYIKFELNTECVFCGNAALEEFVLLDGIAKFEFNPAFNIWAGRLLVPADRRELNGPYFSPMFQPYRTPFYPSDFSVDFGDGGAGVYARDQGVNFWGNLGPRGAFQYVAGVFNGLDSATGVGPNQEDTALYAARVSYNFLEVEKNPGYYTSGTYYGTAGDIFTVAYAVQYQEDGAGSFNNPGDMLGMNIDWLFEKVLANKGVFTFEGEFKYFDSDYGVAAFADPDCFCMFDGQSYSASAFYLFPEPTGWGKFQPYVRYSYIDPDSGSTDRDAIEGGLNYIIDGHNARVSAYYEYGDILSEGIVNFAPGLDLEEIGAFRIGVQLQI